MKKMVWISAILSVMICLMPLMGLSENSAFAFEASRYDLYVGKMLKVKPVAQGIKEKLSYTWSSSDETVATVKDGTIKGISAGQSVITCTATAKDGQSYEASFTANVQVQIKKITSDVNKLTLAPRDIGSKQNPFSTARPVISIEPSDASVQKLAWSSSNEAVANVDEEGVITASYSSGTATITGKAMDDSGKTVKITVTVPKCFVTEKNITVTEESGAEFYYIYSSVNGISFYSTRVKGKAFDIDEEEDEKTGMNLVKIRPLAVGSGSISFVRNGSTLATVNVKVDKSAVRNQSTYPLMDIDRVLKEKEDSLGKNVHQIGVIAGSEGDRVYAYTDTEPRHYFAFSKTDEMDVAAGGQYLVYGKIQEYIMYTTETGLSYECPLLSHVTVNKMD